MAGGSYYKEFNIVNTDYTDSPTIQLDFIAPKVLIVLDSTLTDIEWSYNGRDTEGKMNSTDETMVIAGMTISKIWLKANVPDGTLVRVWAGNGAEELEFLKKIKMITGLDGDVVNFNAIGERSLLVDMILPFIEGLSPIPNAIRQTKYSTYWLYDIYNDTTLLTTLKIWEEDDNWRIEEVPTEYLMATEEDQFLVQENNDEIILE